MDYRRHFSRSIPCSSQRFLSVAVSLLIIVMVCCIVSCQADRTAAEWNELGESYYSGSSYDEAISAYMNAISINPSLSDVWNNLGLAYEEEGRYNEAMMAFKRAVSLNSRYVEAWNNLGDVYEKLGRYDDAKDAYQHATLASIVYPQRPPYDQQVNLPLSVPSVPGPGNQPFAGPQFSGPFTGGMNPGSLRGR